mgnify:CR=1 FL=1
MGFRVLCWYFDVGSVVAFCAHLVSMLALGDEARDFGTWDVVWCTD